jgi:hypothetical protein
MNLRMAVVTTCNAIVCSGNLNLIVFQPAEFQPGFLVSGLKKTASPTAAIIIGTVGMHLDKIFFTYHGFDYKAQIFGNGVSVAFAHDLTGILNCELDFQILVPVGIHVQFPFPNPLGVVFVNVFDLKFVRNVEFFQSCQD